MVLELALHYKSGGVIDVVLATESSWDFITVNRVVKEGTKAREDSNKHNDSLYIRNKVKVL